MPALIFSFLRSHWAGVAALLALASLALMAVLHDAETAKLKLAVEECRSNTQGLAFSNASLLAVLKEQNAAVEKLRGQAVKKLAAARQAGAEASQRAGVIKKRAAEMMNAQVSGEDCAQMKELISAYIRASDAVR